MTRGPGGALPHRTSPRRAMIRRLGATQRGAIVAALGASLTVSWASSYYIPAVLAVPMAASFGLSPVWVFGAFSMAMVVSAMVGP